MTPEQIIHLLDQRELRPKSVGAGKWQSCCPAHDDRKASLAIGTGQDDRVLLHCHAGCELGDVLAGLNLTAADLFSTNGTAHQAPPTDYIYEDEHGSVVMKVVRKPGKKFSQARPDGNGGWIWNLDGVERVLYRLPQVLAAVADGRTIYVAEGEKDVQALERAGVVATTHPGGVGKWRGSYSKALAGAEVIVVADRDEKGIPHARAVAESLRAENCRVTLVEAAKGKDAADHLAAGLGLKDFKELAAGQRDPSKLSDLLVDEILGANPELDESDLENIDSIAELKEILGAKKSGASEVVKMVEEADVQLFHDPEGSAFATFEIDGHKETWRVKSAGFKGWVRRLYHEQAKKALNGQSVADALALLEARATFDGLELDVHLRVAEVDGAIYVDLGDEAWRTIAITRDGWHVTDSAPVRFRRTRGMRALPDPVPGGSLELLRAFVNVSDEHWHLVAGFLLAAARLGRPCPVLVLQGEHGSAKSTSANVLRAMVDPSTVGLRATPSKMDDLMVSASSSWLVSFDNISHLQPWLSDALCRLCTGGGLSKRELYTDADEILLNAQRPVLLNGIGEIATRSDLLDRAVLAELPVIPDQDRVAEKLFWPDFYHQQPKILGGLCDALAGALGNVDRVHLDRLPRMADFATWVIAAEPALGWTEGAFMANYMDNRDQSHELAVEASVIGALLRNIADVGFEGTFSELYSQLEGAVEDPVKRQKDWPKSARGVSSQCTRLAPDLRRLGYAVDIDRKAKRTTIRLGRSE